MLYNADIVQQIHHGALGIAGHIVAVEPEFQLRQIADVLAGKVNCNGCPCALGRIGKGAAHVNDLAAVGDVQIQAFRLKRLLRINVDQQLLRAGQIQTACVPAQVRKRAGFLLIGAGDAQRCPIAACSIFGRNCDAVVALCVPVRSAVHCVQHDFFQHRRRLLLLADHADIVHNVGHGALGITRHVVAVKPEFQFRQLCNILIAQVNGNRLPFSCLRVRERSAHIDHSAVGSQVHIEAAAGKRRFQVDIHQKTLCTSQIQFARLKHHRGKVAAF